MPRSVLRVGTRGSALALAQAETIRKAVSNVITHRSFELVPVTTTGDTIEGELPPLGGKGLFVSDIQEALASGKIDLAVHSAKDLPAKGTDGVALAGLKRLNRADRVAEILPISIMLPAPGQGALAVECRANDKMMRGALAQLDDPIARAAFDAERSFMLSLGGDCNLPLGALAE